MGKVNCSICKEMINDNTRIVVNVRHLGSMRVLDNLHENCWNKLIKERNK